MAAAVSLEFENEIASYRPHATSPLSAGSHLGVPNKQPSANLIN